MFVHAEIQIQRGRLTWESLKLSNLLVLMSRKEIKRQKETRQTQWTRWCHLLNHAPVEPQDRSQPFFFFFLLHTLAVTWALTFSTDTLISSLSYHTYTTSAEAVMSQSHAKCHSSYTFGIAGQPNYKTCPSCRFHPINSSVFQENGRGKGYTQGCGCGYGLLSLTKESEFVCSQRKFFMGGLTQG